MLELSCGRLSVFERMRRFPAKVRVAAIKRATRGKWIFCEECGGLCKRFDLDHIIARAHGGKSTLENCMVLCQDCHGNKTPNDTRIAAKLKRIEAKDIGATKPEGGIKSRGFAKKEKPEKLPVPPPRRIYE